MENGRPLSEMTGNWLKGVLVRAYVAQRDHFLELHARSSKAFSHNRPVDKEETGRQESPRSTDR